MFPGVFSINQWGSAATCDSDHSGGAAWKRDFWASSTHLPVPSSGETSPADPPAEPLELIVDGDLMVDNG